MAPLNPGGHYDVTSGVYTVPIDGIYQFSLHLWANNDAQFYVNLEVDENQVNNHRYPTLGVFVLIFLLFLACDIRHSLLGYV